MAAEEIWSVWDLDGVLADVEHRLHHIRGRRKNWHAFHSAAVEDEPISFAADIVRSWRTYATGERRVLVLTGRTDDFEGITRAWLEEHDIPFDELVMRAWGDYRPAEVMKAEVVRRMMEAGRRFAFAVEDTPKLVRMFRERLGIPCLHLPSHETGISTSEASDRGAAD